MSRARLVPWVVVAGIAVVLLGLGVLLAVQALALNDEEGLSSSERAAMIQALGAAGALAGTAALVGVTAYYAWVTAKMLERGGPIITVEIKQAWVHVTGAGCVTLPLRDGVLAAPPDPEYPRFMFAVEVRNSGGAGTTIDKAAIEMEGGVEFWQPAPTVGPRFPHRLETHSSVTFFIEPHAVSTAMDVLKLKPNVVGLVALASGTVHRTSAVRLRQRAA